MILFEAEAEVGESAEKEINLVEKGQDYGWNVRDGNYAVSFENLATPNPVPDGEAGTYLAPFSQYDHADGNAISGGYVYEGLLKALQDKYIFSDIIGGRLWYLNLSKGLTHHTIYELLVQQNSLPITIKELSPTPRPANYLRSLQKRNVPHDQRRRKGQEDREGILCSLVRCYGSWGTPLFR